MLVNFCSVISEFLTWSFVFKHFWYFGKNYQWKSNLGLTNPHLILSSCNCFHFWWKIFTFDQQHLITSLRTQNGEKLSLDLIFINDFWQNKPHFKNLLKTYWIQSKQDRNWQDLSLCALYKELGLRVYALSAHLCICTSTTTQNKMRCKYKSAKKASPIIARQQFKDI